MNDFPNPPIDSIAGLASFKFIEVEGVYNIPIPINQKITTAISRNTGYSWRLGYGAIDSTDFSESGKQSDDGPFIESQLKGFTPDSEEMLQLLVKMDGRRFVLHVIDNDGLERIVGTIEQPLSFTCDFIIQTVSGVKGYHYKFNGLLSKRSPIYDSFYNFYSSASSNSAI
ncbi:MAG: hypothetical protein HQ522_17705 [Bacteroidetes bacterium]|nr:hypothetical protein [Bacteroidota bacterium]